MIDDIIKNRLLRKALAILLLTIGFAVVISIFQYAPPATASTVIAFTYSIIVMILCGIELANR